MQGMLLTMSLILKKCPMRTVADVSLPPWPLPWHRMAEDEILIEIVIQNDRDDFAFFHLMELNGILGISLCAMNYNVKDLGKGMRRRGWRKRWGGTVSGGGGGGRGGNVSGAKHCHVCMYMHHSHRFYQANYVENMYRKSKDLKKNHENLGFLSFFKLFLH